jgi:hypothetical protein
MTQWLWKNKQNEFDMVVVFANTGEENEETLSFVHRFSSFHGFPVVWVEAVFNEYGKGTAHKIVSYETASRNGQPFEEMIKKYGIPNQSFKHCNRELKLNPIHDYIKNSLEWEDYYTAIGIRVDEFDRMNPKYKDLRLYYPLITEKRMTKKHINFWFTQQPFRLNLKGYQGNCKTCWKKSSHKLYTIAKENPEHFDSFKRWEDVYGETYPEQQANRSGKQVFFRNYRSVDDIFKEAEDFHKSVHDDSIDTAYQFDLFDQDESCDIFSECGH